MKLSWDVSIGLFSIVLSVAAITLWFPHDIAGGFTETTLTGRVQPGDAFYPTVLATLLGVLGLAQVLNGLRAARSAGEVDGPAPALDTGNLGFVLILGAILGVSGVLCYLLSPWLSELANGGKAYRLLRDTAPWKFLGFVLGALALIWPLIVLCQHRVSRSGSLFALVAVAILLVVFGMALPDTFLPPNAEF